VAAPVEPARPAMTKIDVTQPVPVQKAEEVKKPTLGLTVDDAPVERKSQSDRQQSSRQHQQRRK